VSSGTLQPASMPWTICRIIACRRPRRTAALWNT